MNTLPASADSHRISPAFDATHRTIAPIASTSDAGDDDFIDIRDYLRILRRRKGTIAMATLFAVVLAIIATFNATPIYRSTLLLQIEREGNRVVDYGSVVPEERGFFPREDFYITQYELLKSRTLARRVIDQLGVDLIEKEPSSEPSLVTETSRTLRAMFSGLFSGSANSATDPSPVDADLVTAKREEDAFIASLIVEPVRESRLANISFESPNPADAAAITNAVARNFIDLNLERRYEASSYAKEFLSQQLEQMRAALEESEKRFIAYAREREIVNIDDRLETLLSKLRDMNGKLVSVEAERIASESRYQELLEAPRGGVPEVLESDLVQALKERRSDLAAEYEQNLQVYKPGYPKMQQLSRKIAELDAEITREVDAISNSVRSEYEAKVREQAQLQQRIAEVKNEALALQDRSTDYETLKREVETNRELYDGLLQRMKEVGVAAGVGENNISIVDPATIPLRPVKPRLTKNLAIALALGLVIGVALAFLLEFLDDSIKTPEDAERCVGAPVLSLVPNVTSRQSREVGDQVALIASRDPKSALAEAARSLRTSLLFTTTEGAPRILHFTSASPTEGKTTLAVSTAIAFAQAGGKVLLIDCDLRNPSIHRVFSFPNSLGLTNHLAGTAEPVDIARATEVLRLFAITSGPLPPNPVELLSTSKMADLLNLALERFDQVILDGPPVIGLADALVLANLAKASIFVAEPGHTRARDVQGAIKRLRQANARILGTVLTKVGRTGKGSGYGYGYGYSYNYLYHYSSSKSDGDETGVAS